MGRKGMTIGCAVLLFLAGGGVLQAHLAKRVLSTDMADPSRVVAARKMLMQAVKGNMVDMNKKMKAGNIGDIATNGTDIATLAVVLPPLFKAVHKEVYPFEGSNSYFKGAIPEAFESAADQMRAAGMAIMNAARKGDPAGVESGLGALKPSCGGCHSAFRGKF